MIPYALYPLTNTRAASTPDARARDLSILAYKAVEAVGAVAQWIVRRYKRHVSIGELSGLNDHLLRDIGVSRFEIPAVVDAALKAPVRVIPPRVRTVRRTPKTVIPVADNDNNQRRFSA